jgi:hypothetical protein
MLDLLLLLLRMLPSLRLRRLVEVAAVRWAMTEMLRHR